MSRILEKVQNLQEQAKNQAAQKAVTRTKHEAECRKLFRPFKQAVERLLRKRVKPVGLRRTVQDHIITLNDTTVFLSECGDFNAFHLEARPPRAGDAAQTPQLLLQVRHDWVAVTPEKAEDLLAHQLASMLLPPKTK